MGLLSSCCFATTIRATVGVSSGVSATSRPPWSSKLYSSSTISSPLLSTYICVRSSAGVSISRKPYRRAVSSTVSNVSRRAPISGG